MNGLIADFSQHLKKALEIGKTATISKPNKEIKNILILGLGGSGIGGTIVSQIVAREIKIPITVSKDYEIPAFVGLNTLVIACSYSGDTEETLISLEQAEKRGAEIAAITSGGKLEKIAKSKGYNHIIIPAGFPPRAAFGYSFPQLFCLLMGYELIGKHFISDIEAAIQVIDKEETSIKKEAKDVAEKLFKKTPIIYSDSTFEGVAIRFRQQINENAKMLCWHHVIPEMNHNELVGWRTKDNNLAVVLFRNDTDHPRTQTRMEINKEIISQYTNTLIEIHSKGKSVMEKTIYLIHLGDWVSCMLADKKGIDAVEVDVIIRLKSELAKS